MRLEHCRVTRAAGVYWLYDVSENPAGYKPPLMINEAGADMIRLMQMGKSDGEVVESICDEYGIDRSTAEEDLAAFCGMLEQQGY